MQFGIHAMHLDRLIPPGMPAEQLLPRIAAFNHAALARDLHAEGFNPIEIGGDMQLFLPHTFSEAAIAELAELKASSDIRFTVHLPLWSVETSTLQTPVRLGSIQAVVDCIGITRPLEPEVYVLHATGALAAEFTQMRIPELARQFVLRQFQSAAAESVRSILKQTGINSRKLAIETIEFPFELTLELAEDLDTSICFDTGHVMVGFSGPVDFFDALEACLPRLAEVHLHDGPWFGPELQIGYGKDHLALGEGDLDVERLLGRLGSGGFDGPIVFELNKQDALQSIEYIHSQNSQYEEKTLRTS